MSNFPNAHKVYDLAAVFCERVIEQGHSFLWPDQEIWTVENADEAYRWYLQNLDPKTFHVGTIAEKGREHSITTLMIAADVYAMAIMTPTYRKETIQARLASFFDQPDVPEPNATTLAELMDVSGIAIPATPFHYSGLWPQRVTVIIGALAAFRTDGITSDATYASLRQSLEKHGLLDKDLHHHAIMEALFLLFPDEIPVTGGVGATSNIIESYQVDLGELSGKSDNSGIRSIADNDRLRRVYDIAAPHGSFKDSAFYDQDVLAKWAPSDQYVEKFTNEQLTDGKGTDDEASISHIVAERAPVYEVARRFEERVIEQGTSLLWPEDQLWTDEAIDQFYVDFQEMKVIKGNSWLQNYEQQLANGNRSSSRILADSHAFLMQFASTDTFKGETKANDLKRILGWSPEYQPNQEQLASVLTAFHLGIGSPGMYFSAHIQYQLAFIPAFVSAYRHNSGSDLLGAINSATDKLSDEYQFKRSVVPAQNIVSHLIDPANFERIASEADKIKIVDTFGSLLDGMNLDFDEDLDFQLREIRNHLAPSYFEVDFDYYDAHVQPYWNSTPPPKWPPHGADNSNPPITDLAKATHLDEARLREIETLLKDKKQLIFEGPPGSGKTFVAEKFARYFTGQSLVDPDSTSESVESKPGNDQIEIVQFHQSYSYEDFVEGIRPRTNDDGQLVYDVEPGIFREFAAKANANPTRKFVLIIDEINRGNVSRILGELMLLLEYRDKSATLPYSKEQLSIPPNLYIIGTMNSADRSLSQIDYALRRRFYFVRFMSVENGEAHVLKSWLHANSSNADGNRRAVQTFVHLNRKLSDRLGTDDLQVGHSYFMRADIHDDSAQQMVWGYAVMPLLREYLYHDRERDEVLATFDLNAIRAELAPQPTEPEPDVFEPDDGLETESS